MPADIYPITYKPRKSKGRMGKNDKPFIYIGIVLAIALALSWYFLIFKT